jgi:hypothetical protein
MPSRDPIRHSINQRLKDSSWRKYAFNALEILDSEPKLFINLENGKNAEWQNHIPVHRGARAAS